MLSSRFNPLFFSFMMSRYFFSSALIVLVSSICSVSVAEQALKAEEQKPQKDVLNFSLPPQKNQSGYEFELEGGALHVQAVVADETLQVSKKTYRFPASLKDLQVSFSVLIVEEEGQLVLVSDSRSSYSFVFITQKLSPKDQTAKLEVRLALRGRLKNENRQLRLSTKGKNLYLINDAEAKICGRRSSRVRRLDWQQVRFRPVRRSPLLNSERQGANPLARLSPEKKGESWASLESDTPTDYSDGDFHLIALPRQSQLYLGSQDLAGRSMRIFFQERAGELYLNAGKELWRIPVEDGDVSSKGGFSELQLMLPEGDCFSLIVGKKSPGVSEILISDDAELPLEKDAAHLVNGYLAGQIKRELLTLEGPAIAERLLELWPSLNSAERELTVEWALRMHSTLGVRLVLKSFIQEKKGDVSRYSTWLKSSKTALRSWLKYGLREPSSVRLAVLELALPVSLEETYSSMAQAIARQPATVRAGFRSLVWKSLDRPGAREAYLRLADDTLKKLEESKVDGTQERRRGAIEWLRIGAQAPEISNADYLPFLVRLGSPMDFREAYVLLEGNLERLGPQSQKLRADAQELLNTTFDWQGLSLSEEETSALYDRLFSELIAHGLVAGRFLGSLASQAGADVRPIIAAGSAQVVNHQQGQPGGALFEHWQGFAQASRESSSPRLRSRVVEWWGMIQSSAQLTSLQELAKNDEWPQVRGQALRALSRYPMAESFVERQQSILRSLRKDPHRAVRRQAALALSRLPSEITNKALFNVINDEKESEVKAAAVRSLGKLCVESAVELLTAQALTLDSVPLSGDELKVALASVSALYRLNPDDLQERMNQLDLKRVPGPYQAGLRAARATAPLCRKDAD